MPSTYPNIYFNHGGICNFCTDYKQYHKYFGKEKLINLINSINNKSEYDCIVPLSGGKDSVFILYYSVKKLGLKPLAVSYDSGFQVEIAKKNVKNACEILNVPLIIKKSPRNTQLKLIRESLLVSKKVGSFINFCGNCEVMLRTVCINTAKKYNVPFVFWGSSALESHNNLNYENYRNLGKRKKLDLVKRLINGISNWIKIIQKGIIIIIQNPKKIRMIPCRLYPYFGYHSLSYKVLSIIQRLQMNVSFKYAVRPHAIPPFSEINPKFIHFFDYISWDSVWGTKVLKEDLGWKHPKDRESRFDCLLHCFANYNYIKKYNISSDGVNYCNVIREHKMERNDAMVRENDIRGSVYGDCVELIKQVGLKNDNILEKMD
jgi:hypothetical protein